MAKAMLRAWAVLTGGLAVATAGCVAPPPHPAPTVVSAAAAPAASAVPEQTALQNRIAMLAGLAVAGTVLPPRIEQIDIETQDASGAVDSVPVLRVDFPEQVFFDFDRDVLWPDAGPVVARIADSIRGDVPGVQVTIVGHTDAIGSDAYNLDLSRRRALSVMRALVAGGVDPAALSTVAVGKRQPAAPDDTPAGRAENRRVEFLISSSLPANLAVIARRPIQAAYLPADIAPGDALQVLRPQADAAGAGTLTLAAVGSVALAAPVQPEAPPLAATPDPAAAAVPPAPEATPEPPKSLPVAQPLAPAPPPAPLVEAPPAMPRPLLPQYVPRAPGASVSY